MNCALLPEDIQRLRISIKKKLVKLIENKETLDVKEQSKAIYDLIFSKTQDENQALDYARMVPKLINQWASYKTEFTDLVLDSGADAGLLKLSRDVLHEETGLDAMRSYLELDKSNLSEELASAYNNSTSSAEELKEFIRNLQQEFKLEIVLDGNEFTFNTNESSNIKGAAEALVQAGYKSKLASITIPDMSGIVKPALRTYTTVESLKEKGTFRGKKVNFVDIIPTSRETPVALTNRKGEIWIVEKLFREKYNEKAWLNPAQLKDGSIAAALGEDQFKSFEEFLTFALIHEVKHDTMFRTEGETWGQLEDRINKAALVDMANNYGYSFNQPTQQGSVNEITSPKNVFTVEPKQAADKKAKPKAKISNKFIGFAEGIPGSSTALYAEQAGEVANTGDYKEGDVIFVSVPGKRGDKTIRNSQQVKTTNEAIKALNLGATIITDNKAYIESNSYNEGEKFLYDALTDRRFQYSEIEVDGQTLGTWSKSEQPTQTSEVQDLDIATLLTNGLVSTKGLKQQEVEGAEVFTKQVFTPEESEQVFKFIENLYSNIYESEHKSSDKFGKGRRSMYFSDESYSYSGTTRPANVGSPELQELVSKITNELGFEEGYFDMVLINEYKDGSQKIGFHTDNEPILNNKGKLNPSVVTISFGDERTMILKGKKEYKIPMKSGLGLIMGKDGQINYKHGIDAEGNKSKRFSITLRHNAEKSQGVDKTLKSTQQTSGVINTPVSEPVSEPVAEPVVEPVKKENPPVSKQHPLATVSQSVRDNFIKVWKAVTGTFFTDRVHETDDFKDGKINKENFRVPDSFPKKRFYYDVKRYLLKEMESLTEGEELTLTDSDGVVAKGIHLEARLLKDVPGNYSTVYKQGSIVLVLVDSFGTAVRFNDNIEPVLSDSKEGKHVVYSIYDQATASEKLTSKAKALAALEKISVATATEKLKKEIALVKTIEDHVKSDNPTPLKFDITGGSMGYVVTDKNHRGPLKNLKEVLTKDNLKKGSDIAMSKEAKAASGITDKAFYITTDGLYGQWIEVERPGVQESNYEDVITSLLVDDLVNDKGEPITFAERNALLRSLINTNDNEGVKIEKSKDPTDLYGYTLSIGTVQVKLDTLNDKGAAKNKLEELYNKKRAGQFFVQKLHVSLNGLSKEFVEIPQLTGEFIDGKPVYKKNEINYRDFLNENNFAVQTAQIAADGKLRRVNAYFSFALSQESNELLFGSELANAEQIVENAEEVSEKLNEEQVKNNPVKDSPSEPTSSIGYTTEDPGLDKRLDQKNKNKAVTEKQIVAAKAWYKNHPLSKHFPFEVLFDKVNAKDPNVVASWSLGGIILYKGSDYTDLYHEAWHAFTQSLLSIPEKEALYNEVQNKKGSFNDYNGDTVKFKEASFKQIEEYLAEEFRTYMINGQKVLKSSPKINSYFRKIWNALKTLFANSSYREMSLDLKADGVIGELFEKLRVGNLKEFSFSADNVMFGKLNSGIVGSKEVNGKTQLDYEQSKDIMELMDGYMMEYVEYRNSNLTEPDVIRLKGLKKELKEGVASGTMRPQEQADIIDKIKAYEEVKTRIFTGGIGTNDEVKLAAYTYAKSSMAILKNDLVEKLADETSETERAVLLKDINTLEFALENFGDIKSYDANVPKKGEIVTDVIAYHISKSKMFQEQSILEMEENEDTGKVALRGFDRNGNETSLKELAKEEILYLLKTLPDVDKNGNEIKHPRFGTTKLANFQTVFNRIARATQNIQDIDQMWKALEEASISYPVLKKLLYRLGDPSASLNSNTENLLITNFWQAFNKTRTPLIQMNITEVKEGEFDMRVGESFNSDFIVGKTWDANFKATVVDTKEYVSHDKEGAYLNINKILADFTIDDAKFKAFEFYHAIGFALSDNNVIKKALKDRSDLYTPEFYYKNLQKIRKEGGTVRDLNDIVEGSESRFKHLQILEAKNSDIFSSFAVTNAEGNMQYEHTLNNSMTIMVNSINNVDTYDELMALPHMKYLSITDNHNAKASILLKSVFRLGDAFKGTDRYGTKFTDSYGEPVQIKVNNLSGVLYKKLYDQVGQGTSSAGADEYTKLIMDMHLSFYGTPELMRHSDKGTSFSLSITGAIGSNDRADQLYVTTEDFRNTASYQNKTYDMLLPHIVAEMERMTRLAKIKESGKPYDAKYIKWGQEFAAFDLALRAETKKLLKAELGEGKDYKSVIENNKDLRSAIQTDLNQYFEDLYNETSEKINNDFGKNNLFIADNVKEKLTLAGVTDQRTFMIKSFIHNSFIHNLESVALLYGDLAQYNHKKQAFHKRNAGIGSTGTIVRTDIHMQNFLNNFKSKSSYEEANRLRLGISESEVSRFTGRMNTAIVQDQNVKSVYYDEYNKALTAAGKDASKYGLSKDGVGEMNEADAQGFITFDAYRQLKIAEGTWSTTHDKLFDRIVKGDIIEDNEVTTFFPVMKGQYWGPLQVEEGMPPVTAFHKYSLFPLIPSVIKGKKLEVLHDKMVKEQISYLTFESGSKVGIISKGGELDSVMDENKNLNSALLNEEGMVNIGKPGEKYVKHFTPNVIHLEFFKNQLEIHDQRKGKVVFATQFRKLVEDGLMENGVPIGFKSELSADDRLKAWESLTEEEKEAASDNYRLMKLYESKLAELTKFHKNKLLKQIGWTSETINGKEVLNGSKETLLTLIRSELDRQDLGDHALDFLKVNEHGQIKHDLSLSLNVEQIEKLLNALMVKKLINQKVNGEGLIQVASTMMEELNAHQGRNWRNPTEKELKEHGTNDLPTYRQGDVIDKKVNIQMQPDNLSKILKGSKTTTVRSSSQAKAIGLKEGESAIMKIDGKDFKVTARGNLTIDEAGGKESMISSEGLNSEDEFKYKQTKDWVNGKDKLYVYDFTPYKSSTSAMKVKVALAGDFLHLLNGIHLDGERIETRERLNKMLKSDEWLDKDNNRQMVTMVGVRIPVQGLNSMEFMEVYEFLPAVAGSIIVPPSEIVTKSGADFDVDKMTVMMPNIATIGGRALLHNSGIKITGTEEELKSERNELRSKIKAVYDKFSNKLNLDEFTEEERKIITDAKANIRVIQTEIDEKTFQYNEAYKKFQSAPALYNKVEELEEALNTLHGKLYNAKRKNKFYEKTFKSIELDALNSKLDNVTEQLNALGKGAIENDLVSIMRSILELPQNFVPLITPNTTDIFDEHAQALDEHVNDVKLLKRHFGESDSEIMSATKTLEPLYNLTKHKQNSVGKEVLGLGAVDNTYNTLLNRIGAYMNPYNYSKKKYDKLAAKFAKTKKLSKEEQRLYDSFTRQTIRLPHNTLTKEGVNVISLSNVNTKGDASVKISDAINQLINGWVDIAADTWIFNIQGNKEVSPVLLFMIQAGVPIKEAIYFASNPLVREYVKYQKQAKSSLGHALGTAPANPNHFRSHARKLVLSRNNIMNGEMSKMTTEKIAAFAETTLKKRNSDFTFEELKKGVDEFTASKTISQSSKDAFLHFLQLEDMTKSVRDLKMRTNVDTSRDVTLFEAWERLDLLEALRVDGRFPADLADKLKYDSPISSFFIQEFQIGLLGDLFPIRNHDVINSFIKDNITTDIVDDTYGDKAKTVINWKSDLVNYIFQNELRAFNLNKLTHYKSREIVETTEKANRFLSSGVTVKDGKLLVDKGQLKVQYLKLKQGDAKNGWGVSSDKFNNIQEYFQYAVEKEVIRSRVNLKSLAKSDTLKYYLGEAEQFVNQKEGKDQAYQNELYKTAYEMYLDDKALTNTFNYNQLFQSNNSYASQFIRIRETYPALAEHFSVMNGLSFKASKGKNGIIGKFKNLALNDSKLDTDMINVFHENLNYLKDRTKLQELLPDINETDLAEIIDFFDKFSIVAFLQSGMNTKSSFALTPLVDQKEIINILEEPVAKFMTELDKDSDYAKDYLSAYNKGFVSENNQYNRDARIRGKNYFNGITLLDKGTINNLDVIKATTLFDTRFTTNIGAINYKIDYNLRSESGHVKHTERKGDTILLNPVTDSASFFSLFEKDMDNFVNAGLQMNAWSIDSIKDLLDTPEKINNFLLFREQNLEGDTTVYEATMTALDLMSNKFVLSKNYNRHDLGVDSVKAVIEGILDAASGGIFEFTIDPKNKDHKSYSSRIEKLSKNPTAKVIALIRSSDFNSKALSDEMKQSIEIAHTNGSEFIIPDINNEASRKTLDYLIEIGAKFTLYGGEMVSELTLPFIKETDGGIVYDATKTTKEGSVKNLLLSNKDVTFVYADSVNDNDPEGLTSTGVFKKDLGSSNKIALTSLLNHSSRGQENNQDNIIKDVDGKIDPKVKSLIDESIGNMLQVVKDGGVLAFNRYGYGNSMLQNYINTNTPYAPQTFVYLSQQLHEKFGFINPKWGKMNLQETQETTDVKITELNDQAVRDLMEICLS